MFGVGQVVCSLFTWAFLFLLLEIMLMRAMKLKNIVNLCVFISWMLKSWWILWHNMQHWEMLDSQGWWRRFTCGNDPFLHLSLKNPPPFCGPKFPQLPTQRTACWPSEDFLSSHFHLPEIQQGTKYLWCFNPTCQCVGAFAFISSALLCYTPHLEAFHH